MDNKQKEWDISYLNRDNFVFYPHEEVIRFVSKYIVKRIGLDEFAPVHNYPEPPRILDVGCGIGRHVFYCFQMGLESYGIDLSQTAIQTAKQWAVQMNLLDADRRLLQGDIQSLPWSNRTFHYAVSHGVFDSMYYAIAKTSFREVARVLHDGALFYCDLISGDDSRHAREFAGEEIVETAHEIGTVQTYYNYSKIVELVGNNFEILEANLVRRQNVLSGQYTSRYHLILRKVE